MENPAATAEISRLIVDLLDRNARPQALAQLSQRREAVKDLGPLLWYSPGTIAVLLREVVSIYPALTGEQHLSAARSSVVCSTLAILQSVASHPDTREALLEAGIPLYLYPLLSCSNPGQSFELLRLSSLGVLGALVQPDDLRIVTCTFLLQTDAIPHCLQIMKSGSPVSRKVAVFILQGVLSLEMGLEYVCRTAQRFYAVSEALASTVKVALSLPPDDDNSSRILLRALRCYISLARNKRAAAALKDCLPGALKDDSLDRRLDPTVSGWLRRLRVEVGLEKT